MFWLKKLDGLKLTPMEEAKQILQRAVNFAVDGDEHYRRGEDGRQYCVGCGELKEYGHATYRCPVLVFTKLIDEVMFRRNMEERKNLDLKD